MSNQNWNYRQLPAAERVRFAQSYERRADQYGVTERSAAYAAVERRWASPSAAGYSNASVNASIPRSQVGCGCNCSGPCTDATPRAASRRQQPVARCAYCGGAAHNPREPAYMPTPRGGEYADSTLSRAMYQSRRDDYQDSCYCAASSVQHSYRRSPRELDGTTYYSCRD